MDEARVIVSTRLGSDDAQLGPIFGNLGNIATAEGRFEEAHSHYAEDLRITALRFGSDHINTAFARANLASSHMKLNNFEEARKLFEAALRTFESVMGVDHEDVGKTLVSLSQAYLGAGRVDAARGSLERAVGILHAADPNSADSAEASFLLAQALWPKRRQRVRAHGLALQARKIYEGSGDGLWAAADDVQRWLTNHPLP